jgi:Lipocalin-like domain
MRKIISLVLVSLCFFITSCGKKSNFVGRWINNDNENAFFATVRTLKLEANGTGELNVKTNSKAEEIIGKWSVSNDVLILDYGNGQTIYWRIVRLTDEKLVVRNSEGKERIYDRVQ